MKFTQFKIKNRSGGKMRKLIKLSVACGLAYCLSSPSVAETVGRVTVELPSNNWSILTEFEGNLIFDQYKKMPLHTKVFKLADDKGAVLALLSITSTEAGRGSRIRWTSQQCPEARQKYFTNDFGSNKQPDTRDCLVVNSAFAPFKFYKEESEVLKALQQQNIQLFTNGYSLRTQYGSQSGTYLNVNLMTTKKFLGSAERRAEASELHEAPEALVAWGEELHKSVKDAVFSVGGQLALPRIDFSE